MGGLWIVVLICWIVTGVLVVYTAMLFNGKGVMFLAGWSSMSRLEKAKYNKKKVYHREAQTMLMLTVPFVLFTVFLHILLFVQELDRGNYPMLIIIAAVIFIVLEVVIAVLGSVRGYKGCESDDFIE